MRLIDQLPRHSHYKAALVNDPETAARIVEAREKTQGSSRPPMTDWSPEVDMLAHTVDALRNIASILVKVNSKGGQGPDPRPVLRPQTEIDRAEKRAFRARMNVLIKKVLPTSGGER